MSSAATAKHTSLPTLTVTTTGTGPSSVTGALTVTVTAAAGGTGTYSVSVTAAAPGTCTVIPCSYMYIYQVIHHAIFRHRATVRWLTSAAAISTRNRCCRPPLRP